MQTQSRSPLRVVQSLFQRNTVQHPISGFNYEQLIAYREEGLVRLQIKSVSKRFDSRRGKTLALQDITLDVASGVLSEMTLDPATPEEIEGTVKVMGGEDWLLWARALCVCSAHRAAANQPC